MHVERHVIDGAGSDESLPGWKDAQLYVELWQWDVETMLFRPLGYILRWDKGDGINSSFSGERVYNHTSYILSSQIVFRKYFIQKIRVSFF